MVPELFPQGESESKSIKRYGSMSGWIIYVGTVLRPGLSGFVLDKFCAPFDKLTRTSSY